MTIRLTCEWGLPQSKKPSRRKVLASGAAVAGAAAAHRPMRSAWRSTLARRSESRWVASDDKKDLRMI